MDWMKWVLTLGCVMLAFNVSAAPKREAACAAIDWACAAECVEQECVESCLGSGCGKAIERYRQCAMSQCPSDDSACTAPECDSVCREAFGGAAVKTTSGPATSLSEKPSCSDARQTLPEHVAGHWVLDGASLKSVGSASDAGDGEKTPVPRADFVRRLQLEVNGCYVLETLIDRATLGRNNRVVVRTSGTASFDGGTLNLQPQTRVIELNACGRPGAAPSKRTLERKTYRYELDAEMLTLTDTGATKREYHFRREQKSDAGQ